MNLQIKDIKYKTSHTDEYDNVLSNVWVIYGPISSWGNTLESALENYKIYLYEYYEIMDK